ncbi:MAG: ABC transporter ATP-binding protein [Tissierellia bacterium]|nr:ABC transporter ATP-binding protein [Tissierellia bacterium]
MTNTILKAKDVSITFGGLKAVSEFNMDLKQGELLGLIGPNGAGKTTVFNMITGVYTPTTGEIILEDQKINGQQTEKIVEMGVARTFQNIRLFGYLSVLDNVKIGANLDMKYGILPGMFRTKSYWKEEREVTKRAMDLLKIFGLDGFKHYSAHSLPYGKQRKLEIARAMATNPKVLLLDEPAAGMNPTETEELMATIDLIRKNFNMTILLIEHDMKLVLGICERLMVLNYGQIISEGDPQEVINDPAVISAYLGTGSEEV